MAAAASSTPIHGNQGRNGRNGRNGNELGEIIERTDSSSSSTSSSWDMLPQEPVTIVDLGSNDQMYEHDSQIDSDNGRSATSENDFVASMKEKMMEELGGKMWAAGKQSARKFYDLYANIDFLRPYFDVEPRDVLKRLVQSLVPRRPGKPQTVPGELYGPVMVLFTLVALLLFSMKVSEHTVQEGTLMGTALGVCFGYWFGASSFYYFLAYLCNTHITLLQILTLTGYALFGHCLTILLTTISHHHSHLVFYSSMLIFGGLSSLKMVGIYVSRTWRKKNGLIVGLIVAATHLLFLVYLHFAYHSVYEDVSMVLSRSKRETVVPLNTERMAADVTKILKDTASELNYLTHSQVTYGEDQGYIMQF
ncbi:protein YIPF3-like [Rhopilema esculentum]|uniref:protein YIPF3-like n=1 Tax=Rhopilema esculentum TaxID=499914 RepID=UPI0031D3A5AF